MGSRPFRSVARCTLTDEHNFARMLTMSDVSERVSGWENRRKRSSYLGEALPEVGWQTLAFSVDPKFSDVLDALIMVDLRTSDPALLSKYLGKTGAQAFVSAPPGGLRGGTVRPDITVDVAYDCLRTRSFTNSEVRFLQTICTDSVPCRLDLHNKLHRNKADV